jgi:hypothetical protein
MSLRVGILYLNILQIEEILPIILIKLVRNRSNFVPEVG